ncbi:MAG: hypothetical protein Kow0068_01330 [Marinilabiliales bacterium]
MRFIKFLIALTFGFLYINVSFLSAQDTDTLNRVDENNMKQGYWVIYDETNTYKVEEGRYQNNRKVGVWKGYYPNGNIKHEITFVNGRADGYAKFYYEDGKVSEEGIWKGNKWVGDYKYYHPNGKPAYEWKFNENGKRTGEQKYYYDNGNLMIEGNWDNGKEKGLIKEYYADGSLKSEKYFNDGKLDTNQVRIYKKDNNSNTTNNNSNDNNYKIIRENNNNSDTPVGYFNGTGNHTTYKIVAGQKKVDREGYFQDGKLINGKKYTYDSNGKLVKTTIYQNGVINNIVYPE